VSCDGRWELLALVAVRPLEDVRALGFLRPSWGMAYDATFDVCWEASPTPFKTSDAG
jgi:hypothetical protein